MTVSILVATPFAAFGELLRISLEDNGQYQVRLVSSGKETSWAAEKGSYQLAILDAAISDVAFVPLCKELLEKQKGIRLVIIPPENDPNHPMLGGLIPHGYINRPFYLPDLVETIARLINDRDHELPNSDQSISQLPSWLQDPLLVQSYLEQELAATQALSGMIGICEPDARPALKVSSGLLNEPAIHELSDIVFRYWNRDEKTDLMRFIRLTADKQDYLVYATQMVGDLILILVYATTSPLSQIRPQAKKLANTLSTLPPKQIKYPDAVQTFPFSINTLEPIAEVSPPNIKTEDLPGQNGFSARKDSLVEENRNNHFGGEMEKPREQVEERDTEARTAQYPAGLEPETQRLDDSQILNRIQSGFSPNQAPSSPETENSSEERFPDLAALLGPIPTPDPEPFHNITAEIIPSVPANPTPTNGSILNDSPESFVVAGSRADNTFTPDNSIFVEPSTREMDGFSLFPQINPLLENEPAIDPLEDTRPHIVASLSSLGQLEPASPALSQLNYTCVLLPRLPQHFLSGELADLLSQWIHQICLAFGWRLEAISLRPDYLQWTVQVAPTISPGNVVRIIRQRTSGHIFSTFPQFEIENPSGDFWAVGYLIVSGNQPPSIQLLREYISQTRKRQGL